MSLSPSNNPYPSLTSYWWFITLVGEERKAYKVLVGKPEGKRPLRRPRCRWEDGIIMVLGGIG
jgi:hypothetical protein